ncbi:iron transport multicopper oxidase Fet3p [[Candida] anglica]
MKLFIFLLALFGSTLAAQTTHTWYYTAGWVTANPDGEFEREVAGFNNTWPLPILRVKKGDRVQLYLTNGFPHHNTTLHFHGLFQNGSAQMDGPEMVTQCPIPPGETFLYNFTVPDQVGTYWYHSHTQGQYGDGMRAAFIIEDDEPVPFEYDEEVVLTVGEWYHETSDQLLPKFLDLYNPTGAEPIPDNLLFNDTHNGVWEVKPNTTYFLRIVNVGGFVSQYLYMDDHDFTVVEVDGIYVKPNVTDMIYITTAQRYGVLVTTKDDTSKNYAFMSAFDTDMLDVIPKTLELNNTNTISYSPDNAKPEEFFVDDYDYLDDFYLEPLEKEALLDEPDHIIEVTVEMNNLGNGVNYAFFNNITYTKPKTPTLLTALASDPEIVANELIYGTNTHSIVVQHMDTVDIVLNNLDTGKHPFHLHGHVFQLIHRGDSVPDDESPVAFDYDDHPDFPAYPVRRDTVYVKEQSNIVLRFRADNPGVWFFHCHIEWHLDQGLALTLIEAPEQLNADPRQKLTENHKDICTKAGMSWNGNAAGNTKNFLDLTGQNVQHKPLPAGFTARGIVALVFSCIAAFLGLASIAYYGMSDIADVEARVARDLDVDLLDVDNEQVDSEIIEESSNERRKNSL